MRSTSSSAPPVSADWAPVLIPIRRVALLPLWSSLAAGLCRPATPFSSMIARWKPCWPFRLTNQRPSHNALNNPTSCRLCPGSQRSGAQRPKPSAPAVSCVDVVDFILDGHTDVFLAQECAPSLVQYLVRTTCTWQVGGMNRGSHRQDRQERRRKHVVGQREAADASLNTVTAKRCDCPTARIGRNCRRPSACRMSPTANQHPAPRSTGADPRHATR